MGRVVDTRKVASAGISVAIHSERFWPTLPSAYPTPRRPRPRPHAVYLRPIPDILRDPPMLSRVGWPRVVCLPPTAPLLIFTPPTPKPPTLPTPSHTHPPPL